MDSPRRPTETAIGSGKLQKTSRDSVAETRERQAKLLEIITKSYLVMSREVPTREERMLVVSAWEEIVAVIPTSKLQDPYTEAMREHEGMGTLGAHELVQAYRRLIVPRPKEYRGLDEPRGGRATPEEIAEIMGGARAKIAAKAREVDARGRASQGMRAVGDTLASVLPTAAEPERVLVNGFEQFEDDGEMPF